MKKIFRLYCFLAALSLNTTVRATDIGASRTTFLGKVTHILTIGLLLMSQKGAAQTNSTSCGSSFFFAQPALANESDCSAATFPEAIHLTAFASCANSSGNGSFTPVLTPMGCQTYTFNSQGGTPSLSPSFSPTLRVIKTIPNQDLYAGEHFRYQIVPENFFAGPYMDNLTLSIAAEQGFSLPSWLTFNATTRLFVGQVEEGSYPIVLVGMDEMGNMETITFAMNVRKMPLYTFYPETRTIDYVQAITPLMGPVLSASLIVICTAYFCKQHQQNQITQNNLIAENTKKIEESLSNTDRKIEEQIEKRGNGGKKKKQHKNNTTGKPRNKTNNNTSKNKDGSNDGIQMVYKNAYAV